MDRVITVIPIRRIMAPAMWRDVRTMACTIIMDRVITVIPIRMTVIILAAVFMLPCLLTAVCRALTVCDICGGMTVIRLSFVLMLSCFLTVCHGVYYYGHSTVVK